MALYNANPSILEFIDPSPSNSGAISTVSVSDNSTLILGSDASRKGFSIFNNSLQDMFVGIDGNVSSDDNFFTIIPPQSLYEWSGANSFTGEIYGITKVFVDGAKAQVFTFS
jgi:hypothetical protein